MHQCPKIIHLWGPHNTRAICLGAARGEAFGQSPDNVVGCQFAKNNRFLEGGAGICLL